MSKINLDTFELTQLITKEDDHFEFKSSGTKLPDLKKKLSCAVSGFANSGGGCFVAGVNNEGKADGGFPLKIGKQDLRDWIDQVIHQVEPSPQYEIKLIQDPMGRGSIEPDKAVFLVAIHESYMAPHMAPDNCYYIRAGAHTVKAKHFIVDAIWAKRHFSKPRLTHLLRLKPDKGKAIQLGILALTDAPALDVAINIEPLPQLLRQQSGLFPLNLSLIDRSNPFFLDIEGLSQDQPRLKEGIIIEVQYHDLAGKPYVYEQTIQSSNSALPISLKNNDYSNIENILKLINKQLEKLSKK
ncbi:MAG: ATP-binding protein [Coleofasciculus chthonoplastes F3-SA18-01]|uniref:AlbA family DNA-binding domain-containing protein n=1 Tax=Coleofasciculus chthonoplastes TaxID=64178 RepID=UPI0032F74E90